MTAELGVKKLKQRLARAEKRIQKTEKRLTNLEKTAFNKKSRKTPLQKKDYKGLGGGIQFLVDKGFFNKEKKVQKIHSELKKHGYHYPKSSTSKMLQIDFSKNKRILNKIKDGKDYNYVIRK